MTTNTSTTIWVELQNWSKSLFSWQKFILTHAINHGTLDDLQVEQAYKLFLQETKLWDTSFGKTEDVPVPIMAAPKENLEHEKILLTRLSNLRYINALPFEAVLTFGPQLTVLFGHNASGKSGFARVLCNACFSRADVKILPNVYEDSKTISAAKADFGLKINDQEETTVSFTVGDRHNDLLRFSVFNTEAARSHLSGTNSLAFTPMGFDVFTELSRIYGLLDQKLTADIKVRTRENIFNKSFTEPASSVSLAVAALNATTDLKKLKELAIFGVTEKIRAEVIDQEISSLRSKSVELILKELVEAQEDIMLLRDRILSLFKVLQPSIIDTYQQQINDFAVKTAKAATVGIETFKQPFFTATGTPEWESFLGASADLAKAEHEDYPREGDYCLLCQRPLDEPSIAFIRRLWLFLDGDSRTEAMVASKQLDISVKVLKELKRDIFELDSRVRTHLQREAPELVERIALLTSVLGKKRDEIVYVLESGKGDIPTLTLDDLTLDLNALLARLAEKHTTLKAQDTDALLKKLSDEAIELRHRQVLSQLIGEIENYFDTLKWIQRATAVKNSSFNTKSISIKENELFKKVIEGSYKTRLSQECALLKCEAPVEFKTKGQRGETVKSLVIRNSYKPDSILSEGEQRAVALADFFTEVNLNPASTGVIFDDPVNSLDHWRKQNITKRLVQEAGTRQVIVFTHDVVFLTMLLSEAESLSVEVEKHWIERDGDDNPGMVTLNEIPADCKTYLKTDKAKKVLEEVKALTGDQRVEKIRNGMGILRRCVEETVLKHLFKDVLKRWDDRIMIGSLKKINWKDEFIDEIDALYSELSRYVEGHSHTEEYAGGAPVVKDLEEYIEKIDILMKKLKSDKVK